MSINLNRNQEFLSNCIWQRNLSNAREIHINLQDAFDDSYTLLHDLLKSFQSLNETDPARLLLSLLTSIGHFSGNSTVNIKNYKTNLNLFLLLIGPSGSGKSKVIAPIKKAILDTIKSLGISKEDAGIVYGFTTASLSAKLAKSNVFIVTDEAEKPLLSMGFYTPLSKASAADRISGCKFFGTIPTTKDTMTYHLEITSHLSFVGATTGRLWHRLITYYAQGHQSDGFSERFLHYAMPKKTEITINLSQSLDYDDIDDDNNDFEEDISDDDYELEKNNNINSNLPSLTQILIISRLLGKRKYILSRTGTKKFYNKIRQYQEVSQIEKPHDINYGSRIGKAAEILSKLAAISQILKISMEILKLLQQQNQLQYDDTSNHFIRNATQQIENKYPSTNTILEIQSSSCHLAGHLLCSNLLKMLFAFYDTEPALPSKITIYNEPTSMYSMMNTIRERILKMPQLFFLKRDLTGPMGLVRHFPTDMVNSVLDEFANHELIRKGPYITSTSRGIVHMKSFPSDNILNDAMKRRTIDRIFNDIKLDLPSYTIILSNSIIKDKQTLTSIGQNILMLPEHHFLYESIKQKYSQLISDSNLSLNYKQDLNNTNNDFSQMITAHTFPMNEPVDQALFNFNTNFTSNTSNQTSVQSHSTIQIQQSTHFAHSAHLNSTSSEIISIQDNSQFEQVRIIPKNVDRIQDNNSSTTDQLQTFTLNTVTSSNIDNNFSTPLQTTTTHETHGKNIKSTDSSLLTSVSNNATQPNYNLLNSLQLSHNIPNVQNETLTSPITNILLSTMLVADRVDQISSNIDNSHNYTQLIQNENNHIKSSTMLPNASTISTINTNNQNSPQIDQTSHIEPTSTNIEENMILDISQNRQKQSNQSLNKNIKPKRNYKRKKMTLD